MADILNQTVFSSYEFFANIIPGALIVTTTAYILGYENYLLSTNLVTAGILLALIVFSAYIAGLAIQAVSAFLEKYINKRQFGGYPSSLYLQAIDNTFPTYFKDKVYEIAERKFGTPKNADSQHVFEITYSYVMQKNLSFRVSDFMRIYAFSRNMMIALPIEATLFFYLGIVNWEALFFVLGSIVTCLTYLFYKRFLRYEQSFAKEVLRAFVVAESLPVNKE